MAQPVGPAGPGAFIGQTRMQRVWGRYFASWGEQDEIDSVPGYDFTAHGPLFGYDRFATEHLLIGGMIGYTRTDLDGDAGSEADINTFLLGLYGSYIFSDVDYLTLTMSYSRSDIDTSTTVSSVGGSWSGETDSNGWVIAAEYGHKFLLQNAFILTPVVGFHLNMSDTDGYTDIGSNVPNATYGDIRDIFFKSKLGLKGDWMFNPAATLKLKALWLHEFSDDDGESTTVKFGSQTPENLTGLNPGNDKGQFGLGFNFGFHNGLTLDVDGDFTVGEEYNSWTTTGKVAYPF